MDILVNILKIKSLPLNLHYLILEILAKITNNRPAIILDHVSSVLASLATNLSKNLTSGSSEPDNSAAVSAPHNENYTIKVCTDTLKSIIPPLLDPVAIKNIYINQKSNELISVNNLSVAEKRKIIHEVGASKASQYDVTVSICKLIINATKNMNLFKKLNIFDCLCECLVASADSAGESTSDSKNSESETGFNLIHILISLLAVHEKKLAEEVINRISINQAMLAVKNLISGLTHQSFASEVADVEYLNFSRFLLEIIDKTLNNLEIVEYLRYPENSDFMTEFFKQFLEYLNFVRKNLSDKRKKSDSKADEMQDSTAQNSKIVADSKLEKQLIKVINNLILILPIHILTSSLNILTQPNNLKNTLEKLSEKLDSIDDKEIAVALKIASHDLNYVVNSYEKIVEILLEKLNECTNFDVAVGDQISPKKRQKLDKQASNQISKSQINHKIKLSHLLIYNLKTLSNLTFHPRLNPEKNKLEILQTQVLPKMLDIIGKQKTNKHIKASTCLFISECCQYLESNFLPHLDKFYKNLTQLIAENKSNEDILRGNFGDSGGSERFLAFFWHF